MLPAKYSQVGQFYLTLLLDSGQKFLITDSDSKKKNKKQFKKCLCSIYPLPSISSISNVFTVGYTLSIKIILWRHWVAEERGDLHNCV